MNRNEIAFAILPSVVGNNSYVYPAYEAFKIADEFLNNMHNEERPAVVGDDWIGVEDRLPKQGDLVLVYRPDAHLKTANDPNIKVCQYRGKQHSSYQFDRSIHKVTHWRPLPNPPIQSGDND